MASCGAAGSSRLGIRARLAGHRVIFGSSTEMGVAFLAGPQRKRRLDDELCRPERIPLLVCDEVGYTPSIRSPRV